MVDYFLSTNSKYEKDIDLLLSQTKRCSDILRNLSKDQFKEDNFLSDIKIEELLSEIVRSFTEISEKKEKVKFLSLTNHTQVKMHLARKN